MSSHWVINLLSVVLLFKEISAAQGIRTESTVSSSGHDTSECSAKKSSCETLKSKVQNNVTLIHNVTLTDMCAIELDNKSITITKNLSSPSPVIISGCRLVFNNFTRLHLEGLHFVSNSANCPHGNAVHMHGGSNINITSCVFQNHSVLMENITGSNKLMDTNFTDGRMNSGSLIIRRLNESKDEVIYTLDKCLFASNNNSGGEGGGLHIHVGANNSSTFIFLSQTKFSLNTAHKGGGMYVSQDGKNSCLHVELKDSHFESNHAEWEGGAVYVIQTNGIYYLKVKVTYSNFTNNSGSWGGGISVYGVNYTMQAENSTWLSNKANKAGSAVGIEDFSFKVPNYSSHANFTYCSFINNSGNASTCIGAVQVRCMKALFSSCNFTDNRQTALHVFNSSYARFAGNTSFSSNYGIRGGAISLQKNSSIGLTEGVNLHFENNLAGIEGGAIYAYPMKSNFCLFDSLSDVRKLRVTFLNNTANGDIQSIYVSSSDNCIRNGSNLLNVFSYSPNTTKQIASHPLKVTLDFSPKGNDSKSLQVMFGEKFYLIPTVTDIFNNTAYLRAYLDLVRVSSNKKISVFNDLMLVGPRMISMDNFTSHNPLYIKGNHSHINENMIKLRVIYKTDPNDYHTTYKDLKVSLVECRTGFVYDPDNQVCKCINDKDHLQCITDNTVNSYACVKYGYWFGDLNGYTGSRAIPCSGEKCQYVHRQCPIVQNDTKCPVLYCLLNGTDNLCWKGMGGVMCSGCQDNFAYTFGAFNCVNGSTCSTLHTTLISLVLVFYWVVNIIFILVIWTADNKIGLGLMSGIVYYFSVVTLFINDGTITSKPLLIIIHACTAITQLIPRVLGAFEVCFVQGWNLDIHHYMFQYVTPIFVISLIIFIILVSRYTYCHCPKAISLADNSPIHAICVLVLFSYTSLTYTSFQILKPIRINNTAKVYADPELGYFSQEHLPFAITALVFEFLISLPICFLLLFAPCLSKKVNVVRLRLKPYLDDFQACYRPGCRWFAGFFFLARQVLFSVSILPLDPMPQETYVFQLVNLIILMMHSMIQPYSSKWLNVLDMFLLTDLLIFSVITNKENVAISYVLIILPTFYLAAVIVLLVSNRVKSCLKSIKPIRSRFNRRKQPRIDALAESDDDNSDCQNSRRFTGSKFFKDYGEREPFLSQSESPEPPLRPSSKRGRRYAYTTSSVRVSKLSHLPL